MADQILETDLIARALADPTSTQRWLDVLEKADLAKQRRGGLKHHIQLFWPVVVGEGDPLRWGWVMDAMAEHLESVSLGEIIRLLMNVPPGFMKSLMVNVFFPSHEWGPLGMPFLQYISAAYGAHLTQRDNSKFRKLVTSELFRTLYPHVQLTTENIIKVENTAAGFKLATSIGGVGTGERGHRFILDDPNNVLEAESDAVREEANRYTAETVPTRLNKQIRDAIIIIQQRTHDHDVSGMILDEVIINGQRVYVHFCIPMEFEAEHPHKWPGDPRTVEGELAFPERESTPVESCLACTVSAACALHVEEQARASLELTKAQLRAVGGDYAEAGQLQQRPRPRGGGMFKEDWWYDGGNPRDGRIIRLDQVPAGGREAAGWDLAGSTTDKSPYTVRAKGKIIDGKVYLLHIERALVDAAALASFVKTIVEGDGKLCVQDFPQDPGQAGKFQVAHFGNQLHGYEIHSSPETGDKAVRAAPFASQCRLGNVILVDDGSGWPRRFVTEAKSFPVGRYKDQIDAVSRLYARLVVMLAGGSVGHGLGMPASILPAA